MNPALAENQFSLARWWAQGDPISHAVAYVLLVMSLASWFFIFSKAFTLWRVRRAAPAIDAFWDAPDVSDGLALLRAADGENVFAPLPASVAEYTGREVALEDAHERLAKEIITRFEALNA